MVEKKASQAVVAPNPEDAPKVEEVKEKAAPKPIPEVRQCQDQEDENFGAVAVKTDLPIGEWFVGRPSGRGAGGHWGEDAEVADWKVLS